MRSALTHCLLKCLMDTDACKAVGPSAVGGSFPLLSCMWKEPETQTALQQSPLHVQVTEVAAAAEPAQDVPAPAAAEEAAASASAPPDKLSSSNAYMLVYRRCDWSSSAGSGPVQLPMRWASFFSDAMGC